jgi:hypothetical protein
MNHPSAMATAHNGLFTALDNDLPALIHGFATSLRMNRLAGRSRMWPQRGCIAPGRGQTGAEPISAGTAAVPNNNRSESHFLASSDTPQGIAALTEYFTALMDSEAE